MIAVVHSCLVAAYAYLHSHFQGDDVVGLYQSRTLPFWKYVTTPIDVHFVPLHRLTTYALGRLAPTSFATAIVVLASFHLLAILFLHRALEAIRPSWQNAIFAAWYGTHVYTGVLFTWWTSGLHRLPYVCLLALALHAYVRYRWKPLLSGYLLVTGCFVAALGFFEKGLLIPIVLGGVELGLWREASPRTRRAVVALQVTLVAIGISYLSLWRHAVGPWWSNIGGAASFLFTYWKLSWLMLVQSAVGCAHDGAWGAFALFLGLMVATIARRPGTCVTWLAGFVVVSVCLELTGISTPRARAWGSMLATFSYRYYPDAMFLLVLFSALACQNSRALGPPSEPRRVLTGRGGSLYAVPALAAVLCVAITSFRTSTSDLGFLCESQSRIRDYMRNVTTGLEPLRRESRPPLFLEGQVPPFVNPIGGWVSQHSVLVGAMGLHARFVPNARAAYRILPTGEVVFGAS